MAATQEETARQLGIRQGYVSRYLSGTVPKPDILAAIARHYKISLDWLLLGRGKKSVPKTNHHSPR